MSTAPGPRAHNDLNQLQKQQNQIMVQINSPQRLPLNLCCGQLIEGSREFYIKIGVPLFEASIKGDWRAAEAILKKNPEMVRCAITKNYDTPLHIAASANRTEYVENLLNMMETEDLELQNKSYDTAFSLAASAGNVETAKLMLAENRALLEIPGSQGKMPLYVAALFARADMVSYLYGISQKMSSICWTNESRGSVLMRCVEANIFDVAVRIVNECSQLTTDKRILGDVLLVLAKKTDAFNPLKFKEKLRKYSIPRIVKEIFAELRVRVGTERRESDGDALQLLRIIWKKIAIMPDNEIDQILQGPPVEIEEDQHKKITKITYPSKVPFIAAEMGNVRFIIELIQSYPDLIWAVDDQGLSIFHVAVKHRQEDIYNLLFEIGSMKELITNIEDNNGNNMLHIVAKAPNPKRYQNVPVVLQMQRELLWFKGVQQMIPPTYIEKKNRVGETPHEIFTKDHEKLLVSSEKYIKETAPQCLVGATIIATMAFTAAFTAPGGYDQDTGIPMLIHNPAFLVFVIADALSLIFSSSSILSLLSMLMLTSRYAELDSLESLPSKLMISIGRLYFSIVTMMIAFCASLFILYSSTKIKWTPFLVSLYGADMISVLVFSQFRFLMYISRSSHHSRLLFNPKKHVLYRGTHRSSLANSQDSRKLRRTQPPGHSLVETPNV